MLCMSLIAPETSDSVWIWLVLGGSGGALGACGVFACLSVWKRFRNRSGEQGTGLGLNKAQLVQEIFAASPDAILVMDPHDREIPLRIVDCNAQFCALHGYSREELIGSSVNMLETEERSWTLAQVEKIVFEIREMGVVTGETVHRRRDGTQFPVEYRTTLIRLGADEFLLGFDRDISVRKQTENAWRASEERYRTIIDNCPVAVFLQDPYDRKVISRVIDVNRHAAEIHGVTAAEMIGRSMNDFDVFQTSYEELQHRVERLRAKGLVSGEATHVRADGTTFPIEFASVLVVLDGREFILGIDRDITHSKRRDAELNESRRLRAVGEMVGGVAHEFNNLLTPMLLYTEMLEEPDLWPNISATVAAPLRKSIIRATELTRRILTFGRRAAEERVRSDLGEVVRDAVDFVGKTIDHRIHIEVCVAATTPIVYVRRTDITQILINLILNARDTLLEKLESGLAEAGWSPQVIITVERAAPVSEERPEPSGWLALRVADNGMGMTDEVKERAFEPFFTTKPVGKGTGLGLAMTWHLIKGEDGQAAIISQVGEGTIINLYLPEAKPGAGEDPSSEAPGAMPALKTSRQRILLVEDQAEVANSVRLVLTRFGYDVIHEKDGAEALRRCEREGFDFDTLLTDLNLPGLHGAELVDHVRTMGFKGKIIAYSGMVSKEMEAQINRAGVLAILEKPFDFKQLVRLLGT